MANSKHAHYRYNVLDYCFRKLALSKKELLSFLNQKLDQAYDGDRIELRQLDSDLDVFRRKAAGFNAPLLPKIRTYQYTNPNFSIAQRPLLEYEQYLVDATSILLERFENHPKYNKLAEALIKFQDEQDNESEDFRKILYYDHNDEYKGIKFLKPLYLVIKKKQVLKIEYKNFKAKDSITFEFHPYLLKQYNRRWFMYGQNTTHKVSEWSIPLDERLLSFQIIDDIEYIESETDWPEYFKSIVGIVKPPNAIKERIVLKFYNARIDHFKTKPFEPDFEEFFEQDKQDQIWFDCIINRELVQQILSYGHDVEVLEPEELKEQMRKHSNTMQEFYSE